MNRLKVYIASPYTVGDVGVNVKRQIDTAHELLDKGFSPYAPLLAHFLHIARPRAYDEWVLLDDEWLEVCDAVLRLPGESKGADREVALAKELSIPIFTTIEALVSCKNVLEEVERRAPRKTLERALKEATRN